MNLPAEAVIIAGDNRWEDDDEDGHPVLLPVHEILNAAGRAGRAGMFAHGLVFLIPGMDVFTLQPDAGELEFDGHDHAAALLGSPDQCLRITDPLTQVMDRVAIGGELPDVYQYLLRRHQGAAESRDATSGWVLRSSFGYYLAVAAGRQAAADALIQGMLDTASTLSAEGVGDQVAEFAKSLGVSAPALHAVVEDMPDMGLIPLFTVPDWIGWLLAYLSDAPEHLADVIHLDASGLLRIFQKVEDEPMRSRWARAVEGLSATVPLWISGSDLSKLEPKLFRHSGRKRASTNLDLARRFHNETSSALGSAGYLIRRLVVLKAQVEGQAAPRSVFLEALPGCLARGFDRPELLALHDLVVARRTTCRVDVHRAFTLVAPRLGPISPDESMSEVKKRVRAAAKDAGVLEDPA